ncbi:MAG: hypothetical protein IJL20_03085 [Lachnospiraceae bacterium]|nr:hypothetical protein [Lachnospiraceae bacterium]
MERSDAVMADTEKNLEAQLMESFKETVPILDSSQKGYILGLMQGISMTHKESPKDPDEQKTA